MFDTFHFYGMSFFYGSISLSLLLLFLIARIPKPSVVVLLVST